MADYQVLARKMRPSTFSDVLGQEAIVQTLKNALSLQRTSHAYLFCGPHGTGKTTLARLFAKALNCSSLNKGEPCNSCSSCLEITASSSMDVLEIDGASNRGVEDIRKINETVGFASSHGRYKIYIIDEVHMLTKEAFNALLKTLEEPPEKVKFFFATTEPQKVLPTILSRCLCFHLKRVPLSLLKAHLTHCATLSQNQLEEKAALLIAKHSQGSVRDALSLLDQLMSFHPQKVTYESVLELIGLFDEQELFDFNVKAQRGELQAALFLSSQVFEKGHDFHSFLERLQSHYHSHLLVKIHPDFSSTLPLTLEEYQMFKAQSGLFSQEQLFHIQTLISKSQMQMKDSLSKRICLEILLIQIIRSFSWIPFETLVQRLEALEAPSHPVPKTTPTLPKTVLKEPSPAPHLEPIAPAVPPSMPPPKTDAINPKSRYDTLMQFAAVELEGTVKKEGL